MSLLDDIRSIAGQVEQPEVKSGLEKKLAELELFAAAVAAMERFGADPGVIAYKKAELDVAGWELMVETVGYHAMVDVDPLLFDNEGPVGPSDQAMMARYERAIARFATLELARSSWWRIWMTPS